VHDADSDVTVGGVLVARSGAGREREGCDPRGCHRLDVCTHGAPLLWLHSGRAWRARPSGLFNHMEGICPVVLSGLMCEAAPKGSAVARTGSNLVKVGSFNQTVILDAIRRSDGISRIELAEHTNLVPQTVTNI